LEEPKICLAKLKAIAAELMIPIVALYRIAPSTENQSRMLARHELQAINELAQITDRFLLLNGTAKNLVLIQPKILG
jgi:hypothetical protein